MGNLYAKNKIYTGYDGNTIGFQASSSVSSPAFSTVVNGNFYLSHPTNLTIAGTSYIPFSGSFQDLVDGGDQIYILLSMWVVCV